MAEKTIPELTLLTSIDRAGDFFEVSDTSDLGNSKRTTINSMLDLTSHPVGIDDIQTLTNKTLTAPTVSSPVLSGTISGTYTLGGTPTFPSSVVTLTGSQTLTNKVLTSPTINSPTITNPTLTVDAISEYTSAAGVTIDGVLLKDSKINGSYITDTTVSHVQLAQGVAVQQSSMTSGAVSTGTTLMIRDDTIPQNTEGNEYMTLAHTPKSTTNILLIQVTLFLSSSVANNIVAALFQDSTANALATAESNISAGTAITSISLSYKMTAGTTSSTTFKVRAGGTVAGTTTFNGSGSSRLYGTSPKSSILITEYKA